MIRVARNRYEEDFRGETLTRDEAPSQTHRWLERRTELIQRDIRSLEARLRDAYAHGGSDREINRLVQEIADVREKYAHASEAKREFAAAWRPGYGYADPDLWESRVKEREAQERRKAREAAELESRRNDRSGEAPTQDASARGEDSRDEGEASDAGNPDLELAQDYTPVANPDAHDADLPEKAAAPTAPPPTEQVEEEVPPRRSTKGMRNTPPDEHKFKKGGPSPNPRGRPKGAKNLKTVIRALASQTVKVKQNGKRKSVNIVALAMQVHANKAAQGDTKAFALVLPLLEKYWNEEIEAKETPLTAEERAVMDSMLLARRLLNVGEEDSGGKT